MYRKGSQLSRVKSNTDEFGLNILLEQRVGYQ